MSARKLRPSGRVTGSGVIWAQHQWQSLLEAQYQFPGPFLWFSKEYASERPARLAFYDGVQSFSLSGALPELGAH